MKLTVAQKLFLSLSAVTLCVLALFVGVSELTLRNGFSDYLDATVLDQMDPLVNRLARTYSHDGGWKQLAENPGEWDVMLAAETSPAHAFGSELPSDSGPTFHPDPPGSRPPRGMPGRPPDWGPSGGGPPGGFDEGPPPPPPEFAQGIGRAGRFAVTDLAGNPVAGDPASFRHAASRDIEADGKVVGHLLYTADVPGLIDARFVGARTHDLLLFAGISLLIITGAAFLLSHHLLGPLRPLTAAAAALAGGNYATRVHLDRNDEFGRLVTSFNVMAKGLEALEMSRRQWVADTSHELRTPVTVLRAHIEALQDGVHEVTPRALERLHGEILNLGKLIDDLHELARADAGAMSLQRGAIDLAELVHEQLEAFRPRFAERGLTILDRTLDRAGPVVIADPLRLGQVFANLFENSARYTDPGGRLEVGIEPVRMPETGGAAVAVRLADSAPGVPAEALGRLFDRFFRVEASRGRAGGGTGLGLAICRSIIEAHEGRIEAGPSPLGGVAITIILPLARGKA